MEDEEEVEFDDDDDDTFEDAAVVADPVEILEDETADDIEDREGEGPPELVEVVGVTDEEGDEETDEAATETSTAGAET